MTDEAAAQIIMRSYRGEKQSATEFGAALEYLSTKGISRYKDAVIWAKKEKGESRGITYGSLEIDGESNIHGKTQRQDASCLL